MFIQCIFLLCPPSQVDIIIIINAALERKTETHRVFENLKLRLL